MVIISKDNRYKTVCRNGIIEIFINETILDRLDYKDYSLSLIQEIEDLRETLKIYERKLNESLRN